MVGEGRERHRESRQETKRAEHRTVFIYEPKRGRLEGESEIDVAGEQTPRRERELAKGQRQREGLRGIEDREQAASRRESEERKKTVCLFLPDLFPCFFWFFICIFSNVKKIVFNA